MIGPRFMGKVAVITGAAQGIGRQIANDMADEGATVIISDINKTDIDATVQEIVAKGGKAFPYLCDISNREQIDKLVETIVATHSRLDILVNNAGILIPATIEETSDQLIDKTIDINLKGVLWAIRAVTPHMKKAGYGRIVNIASITGKNGDNSSTFVYGATKGAVMSLTRSVARQLGPFGVTCNAVAPHAIMTNMMLYWDDAKKKSISDKIPVRRLGTPLDVSRAVLYLAADESSFVNGEVLNINGGYYMD
ncbi:MAG TPA: SDR family NAD(P)-dependent oxidoreductase [Rectinemataceae bacterium]|nr:SDR family NAD(P)-dependent oxidoreductase [Rectinemataceae bacterium]